MPDTKKPTKRKTPHTLFMRRSYQTFKNFKMKHGPTLPFDLEQLRARIRLAIDNGVCPYFGCFGEKVTAKNFSADHATPVTRGGKHNLKNLVICSRSANMAKGSLTIDEFGQLIRVLQDMELVARQDVIGRLKAGGAIIRLQFLGKKKA